MKTLSLVSPGHLEIVEVAQPVVGKGEVLVAMKACGVCGTDLDKLKGEAITPPVLGHEVVGEVAKVGPGVREVWEGERVFAHHHTPCHSCGTCSKGENTLCSEFSRHNIRPGGFAEYFAVPAWNVERGAILELPDSLSYDEASFVEPLACCLRGFHKIGGDTARSAVIYGAGPTGLTYLLLLKSFGCRNVAVADLSDYRSSLALRLGSERVFNPSKVSERDEAFGIFGDDGPDLAVVATGSTSAVRDALQGISTGGKILLFGVPPRGSSVSVDMPALFLRGATVASSYSSSENETREALRMLATKKIALSTLVTHTFELQEAPEAFRVAREQKCMKAIVHSHL